MTIGAGKYDEEATMVMERTKAKGVILLVIDGDRGEGFAVQATLATTLALPTILRTIADQLEDDITQNGLR